jgi:hypothetical protein
MTDYKTLRVPESAYNDAKHAKRDGETWGEYLQRCSDNPPEIREFVEADASTRPVTLEATEYSKIADEVEARLR